MKHVFGYVMDEEGEVHLLNASTREDFCKKAWEQFVRDLFFECHCDAYHGFECGRHGLLFEETWRSMMKEGFEYACTEASESVDVKIVFQEVEF